MLAVEECIPGTQDKQTKRLACKVSTQRGQVLAQAWPFIAVEVLTQECLLSECQSTATGCQRFVPRAGTRVINFDTWWACVVYKFSEFLVTVILIVLWLLCPRSPIVDHKDRD